MNATTPPTAKQIFTAARQDVARLMDWLQLEIDKMEQQAADEPDDWGYAGSMEMLKASLINLLCHTSHSTTDQIKALLATAREA